MTGARTGSPLRAATAGIGVEERMVMGLLFGVALAANLLLRPTDFVGPDARTFLTIAHNALQPGFWSDPQSFAGDFTGNFWSVGYPTFVSLLLRLGSRGIEVVQVVQIILSATLSLIAWQLARHLGKRIRLAVMAIVAVSPSVLWMSGNAGYEVLLSWLLLSSLAILWGTGGEDKGAESSARIGQALGAGVLIGCAVLVQTKSIAVLPVLLWLVWRWGRASRWSFLMGLIAVQVPWMIRNLLVMGSPNPFATNGPYNLWLANNSEATTGGYLEGITPPPGESGFLQGAVEFVISQPEMAVTLLIRRMGRLLEPIYLYPGLSIPSPVRVLLHFATAGLAFAITVGCIIYLAGRLWAGPPVLPAVGPLALFVGLFYVAHLPFITEARYMAPVAPVMVVVATSAFAYLRRRLRSSAGLDVPGGVSAGGARISETDATAGIGP